MKPRIRFWKNMWECYGNGLHSFESSPERAYARWLDFNVRMREVQS